jgi:hypothetical protein
MRPARPRFGVRWLLALVAGVAVLIGASREALRLYRISTYSRGMANYHGINEQSWAKEVRLSTARGEPEDLLEIQRSRAAFHHTSRLKYERWTRYPWLSVEPVPPEPK